MQQEVLKQELQKFNVTDTLISEMKEKFMPLTVSGLDDREGLKIVHDARILVKGKRVEVEKVRKALNADALTWQKAVNEEAKRITGLLEPIESHLEAEENKIELEKERIRKEQEQKEQEKINTRIASLIAAGCVYDGKSYSFAHLTIDSLQIKLMDDQPFGEFMSAILIQKELEDARKAEESRIKQEEETRLKAEREALEKAKKEQADREAKFKQEQEAALKARAEHDASIKAEQERIAAEMAELQKRKDEARVGQLFEIGLTDYSYPKQSFCLSDISVSMVDIKTMDNDKWAALLTKLVPEISAQKQKDEELKAEQLRKNEQEAADRARAEAEAKANRETQERAKEAALAKEEAARQEALRPDKEKLQDFAAGIIGIAIPEVASEGAQQIVNDIRIMLGKIQTHTLNKIKTL